VSWPSGAVTFLFTDIERSTRRWQDEPEAMRALLLGHYAILREVIDKHHGHLFKRTGDGVAVVSGASANASRGGGRRRSALAVCGRSLVCRALSQEELVLTARFAADPAPGTARPNRAVSLVSDPEEASWALTRWSGCS